ncbi:hypothetical protein [Nostoc sp. NMS8]|uniref:hypothetical protein n=1 Tax=Nostoc sp. NMS8 TaxID=2815392 RepID=UPI0025E5A295|nr:hypothetical protein [Nostoc sp. NMS8]MBN3959258.1 hypothetical protein [Nostoc sp. NMS8]
MQNITTDTALLIGSNGYCDPTYGAYTNLELSGKFSISANQSLGFQYYANNPVSSIYNLGGTVGDGSVETYTIIDLWKVG